MFHDLTLFYSGDENSTSRFHVSKGDCALFFTFYDSNIVDVFINITKENKTSWFTESLKRVFFLWLFYKNSTHLKCFSLFSN